MVCVRSIGKGAMHFVGLAKMGKTKYTVSGRKKNAAELIATYERERGKSCRNTTVQRNFPINSTADNHGHPKDVLV